MKLNREERRRLGPHDEFLVGRVRREIVAGEVVSISLDLMREQDVADITHEDGDPHPEFVTIFLAVDPFEGVAP